MSRYPTVSVVWNPLPADLFIGPDELARGHVAGQPRDVLLKRTRPGPAAFRIPATAPGRYLVLLYDGEEGGAHYSWDYVTVRPEPRPSPAPSPHATTVAAQPPRPAGGLDGPAFAGLTAAAVALLGAGIVVFLRRQRS